jgi:predicted enzyme related to lactoylglutathione lyase
MPKFSKPVTGQFCWVELQTKDVAASKKFYAALFGWALDDMPMPEGSYTMAALDGNHVAGLMKLPEQASKMGAPPNWASYIAVDDVKKTTDAAEKLGGKILMGPTAMGPGTFSVIQDPTGGVFLTWHTTQSMGTFLYGEPGALTWNELLTTNVDRAQSFYTRLFGWKAESAERPGYPYTVLKNGDVMVAGLMPQFPQMKGAPSVWAAYFAVADTDAAVAKAVKLGAKVLVPATDIPGVGRYAWVQDPQGATLAIVKVAPTPAT